MSFVLSVCFAHINHLIPYTYEEIRGYLSLLNKEGQTEFETNKLFFP